MYLVAWDASQSSQKALEFAKNMATKSSAELIIWRGVERPRFRQLMLSDSLRDAIQDWLESQKQKAEQDVSEKVEELKARGLKVQYHVSIGDVLDALIEVVSTYQPEMVFLGKSDKEDHIGSFALKVLRMTRKPVWVVPPEVEVKPLNHLLVPVDLTIKDSAAFQSALTLANIWSSRITLLHVLEIYLYESPAFILESLEKLVHEELNEWQEQHTKTVPVSISTTVIKGVDAVSGILDYVHAHDVDAVIMDSHTRTGILHWLLGSVTEKVLARVTKPVLITRPET